MKKRSFVKFLAAGLALTIALLPVQTVSAYDLEPHEAEYGYYADTYMSNSSSNSSPKTNPTIGVLSGYLKLWFPGNSWSNGTILNDAVIRRNIELSYEIAQNRTAEEAERAYEIEFINANWLALDGLEEYKDKYIELAMLGTNTSTWSPNSRASLRSPALLVQRMRDTNASTTPAKSYYRFPRPYRWNVEDMTVLTYGFVKEQVVDKIVSQKGVATLDPASDGGFPSGHTNGVFIGSYAVAYTVPEKFQEVLLAAVNTANYRIVAGMHSPLDVMGGRITGTALSASIFNDKESYCAKLAAKGYKDCQTHLIAGAVPTVLTLADYTEYKKNLEEFEYYLTYGFEPIEDTTLEMRVPKGAEAMLETRLPYLTADQRRAVIYTTGLPSGYPLLDDAEGWGRINYYKAASGYGALLDDVIVTMDASLGSYNACDTWLNDISGEGSLTLMGNGTLGLAGSNTFTGGVNVKGGELVMVSAQALGTGNVAVSGGILSETVDGAANVSGNYSQTDGTLKLTMNSADDVLTISGTANIGGKLVIELTDGYVPANNAVLLNADSISGSFASVEVINGTSEYEVVINEGSLLLVDVNAPEPTPVPTEAPVSTNAPTTPAGTTPAGTTPAGNGPDSTVIVAVVAIIAVAVVAVVVVLKRKNTK